MSFVFVVWGLAMDSVCCACDLELCSSRTVGVPTSRQQGYPAVLGIGC